MMCVVQILLDVYITACNALFKEAVSVAKVRMILEI
jgi:hypothetical protein